MGRKLVRKDEFCDQVDFCPSRGPDAPFALQRSYHEHRGIGAAVARHNAESPIFELSATRNLSSGHAARL